MGHAIPACEDLSALTYADMKIGDVPNFTIGILNFSYYGCLHSRVYLHDQFSIKTLDLET